LVSLGRLYTGVNSLDEIYESEDLSIIPATSKFEEKLIDLASVTDKTKGVGFVCRYKEDDDTRYYAKVVVKSDGTSIVRGSGSNAFIEVEVSYQKEKNVPYAKSN
jgi:hypothetical protein